MKVVNMNTVLGNVITKFIGGSMRRARFDAAAGHPDSKTAWVVVSSVVVRCQFALRIRGAPKFTAPDDQRIVQQPALL